MEPSIVRSSRAFRSRYLRWVAEPLVRLGIPAQAVTLLSFGAGLASVYFLFADAALFVAFGVLHVFLDAIDGVLARAAGVNGASGRTLDYAVDQSVIILALAKSFYVLEEAAVILALGLVIVHQAVYLLSRRTLPVLYVRTLLLVVYAFGFFELGYIAVGAVSAFGLVLQIRAAVALK